MVAPFEAVAVLVLSVGRSRVLFQIKRRREMIGAPPNQAFFAVSSGGEHEDSRGAQTGGQVC